MLRQTRIFRRAARCAGPLLSLAFCAPAARAQSSAPPPDAVVTPLPVRDLFADTWVAADALGRALPGANADIPPNADAGTTTTLPLIGGARAPQRGKTVGIFYFLWQGEHGTPGPYDISKQLAANPAAPQYGPVSAFHWWGEPAAGYFRATDPWLARKNLAMLSEAGVDVLFCDVTNAFTYPEPLKTLCEAARAMRREGLRTPQIGFVTHARGGTTVTALYDQFYSKNRYRELWFKWDDKPLMLGDVNAKQDDGTPMRDEVKAFFSWRNSWAWQPGHDQWQWIDNYPQRIGWHSAPDKPEEVPVSIAGHPTSDLGRSFRGAPDKGGQQPPVDALKLAAERDQGVYFGLQWRRALEVDPPVLFLTGWNEWVAQRFVSGAGGGPSFLGRALKPGETFFVDAYNEEFSRDAMPMKGGHGDNYYLQIVDGIRRFKGARPVPKARGFHTPSNFAAWNAVAPEYRDAGADTLHRDWPGWGELHYSDATGRNDIISAKIACNATQLFCFAQTAQPLTPFGGEHWMQLLIDADRNPRTGWNGYDFEVNRRVISATQTTLTRLKDGKVWRVPYRAQGNRLMVTIPRALLGLDAPANAARLSFDFHWLDGAPIGGDATQLWYQGDNAPDGRFNYRFSWTR